MKYRCPICKRTIITLPEGRKEEAQYFPFCSRRCRLLDLGAWFDCEYRVISKTPSSQDNNSPQP
ncbi:MAG: DNA gyrase inhibitor YacG [Planctomycetota bacterium]